MSDRPSSRVGVRELRQNLSVYLDRVKSGESLTVTERGAEVARLVPLAGGGSTIERLIAEGRARPSAGSMTELGPPPKLAGAPLSRTLRDLRAEEPR